MAEETFYVLFHVAALELGLRDDAVESDLVEDSAVLDFSGIRGIDGLHGDPIDDRVNHGGRMDLPVLEVIWQEGECPDVRNCEIVDIGEMKENGNGIASFLPAEQARKDI
jgi:hypothetical protein